MISKPSIKNSKRTISPKATSLRNTPSKKRSRNIGINPSNQRQKRLLRKRRRTMEKKLKSTIPTKSLLIGRWQKNTRWPEK
jgi:hypothetical protein